MDFSQKYIDMSREAIEIQELWIPQDGDYYYGPDCMPGCRDGVEEIVLSANMIQNVTLYYAGFYATKSTIKKWDKFTIDLDGDERWSGNIPREQCIWLPKQDQLQKHCNIIQSPEELLENIFAFYIHEKEFMKESLECIGPGPAGDSSHRDGTWSFAQKYRSMEQIWLANLMSLNFNKYWKGTVWNEQKIT